MCRFSLLFKGNIYWRKVVGWFAQGGIPKKNVPEITYVLGGNSHGC